MVRYRLTAEFLVCSLPELPRWKWMNTAPLFPTSWRNQIWLRNFTQGRSVTFVHDCFSNQPSVLSLYWVTFFLFYFLSLFSLFFPPFPSSSLPPSLPSSFSPFLPPSLPPFLPTFLPPFSPPSFPSFLSSSLLSFLPLLSLSPHTLTHNSWQCTFPHEPWAVTGTWFTVHSSMASVCEQCTETCSTMKTHQCYC